MKDFTLECCVDSTKSAIEAQIGGATRLELCSNLIIGGTSPSLSLFKQIKKYVNIPIRVLLRPRFGDFCYDLDEMDILLDEVKSFAEIGADGIVIGCLKKDGSLDIENMSRLIDKAKGVHVTLHRAFDICSNQMLALKQAKQLGISTILTSGAKSSAIEGIDCINELCKNADDIEILAGAGIKPQIIKELLEKTSLKSFHMSGKVVKQSEMQYKNPDVFMGLEGISEYEIWQTDSEIIRSARDILENY